MNRDARFQVLFCLLEILFAFQLAFTDCLSITDMSQRPSLLASHCLNKGPSFSPGKIVARRIIPVWQMTTLDYFNFKCTEFTMDMLTWKRRTREASTNELGATGEHQKQEKLSSPEESPQTGYLIPNDQFWDHMHKSNSIWMEQVVLLCLCI